MNKIRDFDDRVLFSASITKKNSGWSRHGLKYMADRHKTAADFPYVY